MYIIEDAPRRLSHNDFMAIYVYAVQIVRLWSTFPVYIPLKMGLVAHVAAAASLTAIRRHVLQDTMVTMGQAPVQEVASANI